MTILREKVHGKTSDDRRAVWPRRTMTAGVLLILVFLALRRTYEKGANDGEVFFIVALFVIVFYLLKRGAMSGSIVNPYYLLLPTVASLLFYDSSISPYFLDNLETSVLVLILWNLVGVILGVGLGMKWRVPQRMVDLEAREMNAHIWILLCLGVLPSIAVVLADPSSLTSGNFLSSREILAELPAGSLLGLFTYGAIAFAIKSRRPISIAVVIIICGLSTFVGLSKTNLFFLVMTVFCAMLKFGSPTVRKKLTIPLVVASIVSLLVSFGVIDSARSSIDSAEYFSSEYGVASWLPTFLVMPVLYFFTPWTNLQHLVTGGSAQTSGVWLVKPFVGYFGLDTPEGAYSFVPRIESFNTFSFIAPHYSDLGLVFSILPSALLGGFIGLAYVIYRDSDSALGVAVYSLVAVATVELFFSNHFFGVSYPFTNALLCLAYSVIVVPLIGSRRYGPGRPSARVMAGR